MKSGLLLKILLSKMAINPLFNIEKVLTEAPIKCKDIFYCFKEMLEICIEKMCELMPKIIFLHYSAVLIKQRLFYKKDLNDFVIHVFSRKIYKYMYLLTKLLFCKKSK